MPRLLTAILALLAVGIWPLAAQQQVAKIPVTFGQVGVTRTRTISANGMIQGNALDSTNRQLNNVLIRLRDARFGRIVDTQRTDKAGLFSFKAIDPGSYIVEIVGDDQSILAASQLLTVNAGDAVSAVVKLPFRVPPAGGLIGGTSTSSAAILAIQAAASGIAAVVPTNPVSPNQ